MSLTTAARQVQIIRSDPSSALAAAIEGWDHPISREAAILMDLWDLEYAKSGTKKPSRYPRPYVVKGEQVQRGKAGGRTPEEVKELLRTRFGQPASSTDPSA